jgi:hypothetical protein
MRDESGFPWWVLAFCRLQRHGDDGLTRTERWYCARRYARGPGNPRMSPVERAAVKAWIAARQAAPDA